MKVQHSLAMYLYLCAFAHAVCSAESPSKSICFPTIGTSVERCATLLAIDDYCLPLRKNLCYYISKPTVRPGPVLAPETGNPNAPDSVATHFYGTVLQENGKFRMWYYGLGWKDPNGDRVEKNLREGPICYAESDDGIHWTKVKLRQVKVHGTNENNAIDLPNAQTEGAFVIRDDDDPDPLRRYKMVYECNAEVGMSFRAATSPDGIQWTAGPADVVKTFIEPCSFYKHNGLYYVNAHGAHASEGGHAGGRQGIVWVSPDFKNWLQEQGESFFVAEPQDPKVRGYNKKGLQVHLGTAPRSMGNVLVGLYCQWNARPNQGDDWFGSGTTYGDFGLVVSHDGQHFREPVKGHVFLRGDESSPRVPAGINYRTILCQANGILNVGEETWIYHGRWANTEKIPDYYAEIGLATLPRDRWGALGLDPGSSSGSLWSAPIALPNGDCTVSLNADGTRGMSIEIADEKFNLLPAYSGDNKGALSGKDGLSCDVKWPTGSLASLAGKTVRFKFDFAKGEHPEPRMYACYVRVKEGANSSE
ncbi:MAG: hypothetical protein IT427_03430 [Pirellulales bacterium]|nr:hypothetical protein [Pirellulales bacterium]